MARNNFSGELLHFGAVRMRVTGTGNLRCTLHSLSDIETDTLPVLAMASATNREPVLLANFTQERAQLEVKTTAMDETFNICKIVFFIKPSASGYPQ